MLWLVLLGTATILLIFLRRVLRREAPLTDELYARKVAIDHVHSGAAWVGADGKIVSMNPALIVSLGMRKNELVGRDWFSLFAEAERESVQEAFSHMVLTGSATLDAETKRKDGSLAIQNVVLVAVHDQKSRFEGHHCLTMDQTRVKLLEHRVRELTAALENGAHQRVHSA